MDEFKGVGEWMNLKEMEQLNMMKWVSKIDFKMKHIVLLIEQNDTFIKAGKTH
jgi:hypothetical protein